MKVCLGLVCSVLCWATFAGEALGQTVTFFPTGGQQTFTVPAGVSTLNVVAVGGSGGADGASGLRGGFGARASADLVGLRRAGAVRRGRRQRRLRLRLRCGRLQRRRRGRLRRAAAAVALPMSGRRRCVAPRLGGLAPDRRRRRRAEARQAPAVATPERTVPGPAPGKPARRPAAASAAMLLRRRSRAPGRRGRARHRRRGRGRDIGGAGGGGGLFGGGGGAGCTSPMGQMYCDARLMLPAATVAAARAASRRARPTPRSAPTRPAWPSVTITYTGPAASPNRRRPRRPRLIGKSLLSQLVPHGKAARISGDPQAPRLHVHLQRAGRGDRHDLVGRDPARPTSTAIPRPRRC